MLRLALAFCATTLAAFATPPVNVLLIVVDDLQVALGAYGDPLAKTPHLDRLAARGVVFERAYAQYPLCNPSRVSFLSGRRPESTGVYILTTPTRTVLPDGLLLPQFYRERGYFTAGAGKIFHSVQVNDAASWDQYQDAPADDPEELAATRSRQQGGDGRPAWTILSTDGERTRDVVNARQAEAWIAAQAAGGKPFFVAAGFHLPHLPWTAPRRFFDLHREADFAAPAYPEMRDIPAIALQTELTGFAQPDSPAAARRAYYACVSFVDEQVGRLLDALERTGVADRTVVALISDHGFHLGDHGGLWAKLSAFDQATRVPFILAGPGVPAGVRVATPVELLDLYPTLNALTGHAAPPGLEGRDLTRPWRGGSLASAAAYSLVYHYDVANRRDVEARTVITSGWRYTEWDRGAAGRELYVHATDRDEYHNRAGDAAVGAFAEAGRALLQQHPQPKPGPANRPRALVPPAAK